jgi:hypothetical protein
MTGKKSSLDPVKPGTSSATGAVAGSPVRAGTRTADSRAACTSIVRSSASTGRCSDRVRGAWASVLMWSA